MRAGGDDLHLNQAGFHLLVERILAPETQHIFADLLGIKREENLIVVIEPAFKPYARPSLLVAQVGPARAAEADVEGLPPRRLQRHEGLGSLDRRLGTGAGGRRRR
ncbi:MAG TPA: hypothetical protein DD477_10505 [Spirochaetaceae bacterium]|nr:hypothetical protein [Spirochaetaceae bacterium]HAW86586.1 hypothetical protein [Spirochaetaceae bacterium]HAX36487.1 hypothetical protein [Spirochaetaceae bacterium]HBO41631.1 hypothetical protein [Spirochaetaceae bacterium]HCQ86486.1 hypothetical protein [Spirochaetaceae bacterium]